VRRNNVEVSERTLALNVLNSMFSKDVFAHHVLDFETCKELSDIIHGKSSPSALELTPLQARNKFAESNFKLVRQICLNYRQSYPDVGIEDLFQMGVLGLLRAVEKWDPDREFMFSTYATWWIRQSITRNAMDTKSPIRIPIHMLEQIQKVEQFLENYREFFGFEPGSLEAADSLLMSEKSYQEICDYIFSYQSLNTCLGRHGELKFKVNSSLGMDSTLIDPFMQVLPNFLILSLSLLLDTLTQRESDIVRLRFGLIDGVPRTLEDIGTKFGLTRERIRQIEAKAMAKLRHPSRREVLRDFLVDYDLEIDTSPFEYSIKNFVVGREPQD
jgi:RNA polymerase primary sigma factor